MALVDFSGLGDSNPMPSPWETPSGADDLQVLSGLCQATVDTYSGVALHSSTELRSDITLGSGGATTSPGAQLCCSMAGSDGYNGVAFTNALQMALYRYDVQLDVVSQTTAVGGVISTRRESSDIVVYYNAGEVIRVTDVTYMTGRSGIFIGLTGGGVVEWTDGASAGTTFDQDIDGALTLVGSLSKRTGKALGGTLTTAGALSKLTSRALAGTVTLAGTVSKLTSRALSGAVTFAGTLTTGALYAKALAGTLTFSGTIVKQTNKALGGAVTFAGTIVRAISKTLVAALTFTSNVSTGSTYTLSLAGTLALAGALARQTQKALTGGLTFVGGLTRAVRKGLAGVLSFTSSLVSSRLFSISLGGTLTTAGAVTHEAVTPPAGTGMFNAQGMFGSQGMFNASGMFGAIGDF
jgi:hypothetical protein